MPKILINATLACCSCALVNLLYRYYYRERNEVIFFHGLQKQCNSHFGSGATESFANSDCSTCKVNKIVEWLNESKKTLDVCMYMISSEILTNTLINAQKRGVFVRVINNDINNNTIWKLSSHGIANRSKKCKNVESLMHHKFIIIDNKQVILGSLNWTMSGIRHNWENVFLTNEKKFVKPFRQEFQRLWNIFD